MERNDSKPQWWKTFAVGIKAAVVENGAWGLWGFLIRSVIADEKARMDGLVKCWVTAKGQHF